MGKELNEVWNKQREKEGERRRREEECLRRKRKGSRNRNTLNPREATEYMKATDIQLQYIRFKQLTTVLGSPN